MALAPLPCSGISNLLKDQAHQEKLQKGEQGGAIFTTTSLHDTTLVYMGVRFTCPGCDSEGQEHRLQWEKRGKVSMPRLLPATPGFWALTSPEHLELSPEE